MNAFGSFKKPRSEPRDRNGRPKKLTAQEVVDVLRKHERWYSLEQSHDGEQTRYLYRAVRTHETELKGRLGKYDIVSIDAFVQPFLVEFSYAHLYEDHDGIELILGCDWRSRGENVDAAGWYQTLHLVTVGALLRMKRDAETAAERTIA